MRLFSRSACLLTVITICLIAMADFAGARSAASARHSGLEPPGGPRQMDIVPGQSPGRTPEGGMGYTDAYGNTLTDKIPQEKRRVRMRREHEKKPADLPDVSVGKPLWTYK